MSKFNRFKRIVVFQRRSGWVCDLGPGSALFPRFNVQDERRDTAAGTKKAIARRRSLVIPAFDEDKLKHLEKMRKEGCELRAILIGENSHIVWDLDSEINLVPFGGGPGQVTGSSIELETDIFEGSIYQGKDLLVGIPWECETATLEDSVYYFPGPTGFQGNRWVVASGDATSELGLLTGSGAPQLEMHFPLSGLQFTLGGTFTGNLKTLDWSGATLTTTTKAVAGTDETGTIDDATWKIQINVTNADTRPTLTVTAAGDLDSDRVGECIDCTDPTVVASSAPGWSS